MFWFILFIIELFVLFFLSQYMSKVFSRFLLLVTKNQKTTIAILAALFFPGVLVHELSHLLIANMLFVRTGEIEFFPQIQGNFVKLGSVAIEKTDVVRRFFIGIAPFVVGIVFMFGIFLFFKDSFPNLNWQTAIIIYVFFEIGNTMYSSSKDMEGAIGLFIAIFVLSGAFYILGFRVDIDLSSFFSPAVIFFFGSASKLLLIPIVFNIICILLVRIGLKRH